MSIQLLLQTICIYLSIYLAVAFFGEKVTFTLCWIQQLTRTCTLYLLFCMRNVTVVNRSDFQRVTCFFVLNVNSSLCCAVLRARACICVWSAYEVMNFVFFILLLFNISADTFAFIVDKSSSSRQFFSEKKNVANKKFHLELRLYSALILMFQSVHVVALNRIRLYVINLRSSVVYFSQNLKKL